MLHPGMAAAFAHGVIDEIVWRRRPECLHVAEPEALDRLGGKLEFGAGSQGVRAWLVGGAWPSGTGAADCPQRVREEMEPHRLGHAGRKQIDDAAAHRVVAALAHGGRAHEAVELEPLHYAGHGDDVA